MSRINFQPKNFVATNTLGTLPFDPHRVYLCVIAEGGDVTVTIDGATFTVVDSTQWAPIPAPMNEIALAGSGCVITG